MLENKLFVHKTKKDHIVGGVPALILPLHSFMKNTHSIILQDYHYNLPEEKIALHPLTNRSDSKLLHYQSGKITHYGFKDIPELLPEDALLFFNNTKVIPARLHFLKPTGALIEIFLLHPQSQLLPVNESMAALPPIQWKCMIGNKKKWKVGETLKKEISINGLRIIFEAEWRDREQDIISFSWNSSDLNFSEVIAASGQVPLPPYIKRAPVAEDATRYQTIYSQSEGAVAAPTAGLHFTEQIIEKIRMKGIPIDYLTLHVSAGTFQPIKESNVLDHPMHKEQMIISFTNVENLCNSPKVVAVGTTALRTLESLYWFGVKLLKDEHAEFFIEKLFPYHQNDLPNKKIAFEAVREWMIKHHKTHLVGETEIFIFPGYTFRVCDGLVTNFHMPGSTLILLVAAFVGDDWERIYSDALNQNYRFLSYGDSSVLLK